MGKTESEVSEWLSGDRNFTLDTLTEIEHTLGVSLVDTESPRYAYSKKVNKMATIIPMIYVQTTAYAKESVTMGGYCKYKKNGTCEY